LTESELYKELGALTKAKDQWEEKIPYVSSLLNHESFKIQAKALWLLAEMGLAYPQSVRDYSALVQPFSGPLSSGLRTAGDVKFTMWASIFATVGCRTFLSFLLAKWLGMGVIGIALAMVLDWCIKAALDIWRFRSGKWKNRRII